MKVISPYKIKKVLFERNYPGYLYRRELVDDSDYGGDGDLEMVNCYESENGNWIGNAKDARMLCKKYGIRDIQKRDPSHSSCCIGFNEQEQKWYGWSHRAIYGFGVGSACKKGDCGYRSVDESDSIDDGIRFCSAENHLNVRAGAPTKEDGSRGVWIEWEYTDNIPNKKLRGTISSVFWSFPEVYGKGEWVAKTIEDAKQMAVDFADGVS